MVKAVVIDTEGAITVDAATVTVVVVEADAGPDQTINPADGATITLDGSNSIGSNLTYSWEHIDGPNLLEIIGSTTESTLSLKTLLLEIPSEVVRMAQAA